jgi:2-amino-4-hydroxy-6-hydroxymethyldihydropteridine diphosphokinase
MDRHTAYLGLGSNLGDRAAHLLEAIVRLSAQGLPPQSLSPIYETDPMGYQAQPPFLNMVVAIDGRAWDPWRLLAVCQGVETALGRRRSIPQGPRTIDLDLLLFGDQVLTGTQQGLDLILPHPRLAERPFVLIPLSDLAPTLLHPVLGKTVAHLLAAIAPQKSSIASVRRYDPQAREMQADGEGAPLPQQN